MNKEKIVNEIECIQQKLISLQLTMELLAMHTDVINVLTLDELRSLDVSTDILLKYWDKARDGHNLYMMTDAITKQTSDDLSKICYAGFEDLKNMINNIAQYIVRINNYIYIITKSLLNRLLTGLFLFLRKICAKVIQFQSEI